MRQALLLLLCFAPSFVAFAQIPATHYSISGWISLVIGADTIPTSEAVLTIQKTGQVVNAENEGAFSFRELTPGSYRVKVIGPDFQDMDTTLVLTNKSIANLNLIALSTCTVNQNVARQDIVHAEPRLLLASGIAPMAYSNQASFNKKYKVKYYDFGCDAPNQQCIIRYNQMVFKYLDTKYGRRWRAEVRKDVVGL